MTAEGKVAELSSSLEAGRSRQSTVQVKSRGKGSRRQARQRGRWTGSRRRQSYRFLEHHLANVLLGVEKKKKQNHGMSRDQKKKKFFLVESLVVVTHNYNSVFPQQT